MKVLPQSLAADPDALARLPEPRCSDSRCRCLGDRGWADGLFRSFDLLDHLSCVFVSWVELE
jgi:hypothetical protein